MEFYLCLWSSIFVYGVLSLSMARLGAKYAEVGCKVYGYFWVHVYAFWGMSMDRLGACMRLLGAKYMETFGCMYAVVGASLWSGWVHA